MELIRVTRTLAGLALAATVIGACSTGGSATATPSSAGASPSMAPESMAPGSMAPAASDTAGMTDQFGSGCAAVPADGEGSFAGMADDPVATAASNNPALSTLVTAVTAAGLGDTLNSADDVTVFAPSNQAFEAMDQAALAAALEDPTGLLTTVLTYHVVPGRLAPADLAGSHETLQGDTVTIEGSGESFTVNGDASVVCGNVQTANATVYIIDGVLIPAS